MDIFTNIDWAGLFVPKRPLAELVIRGTVMYLVVFVLLRLDLRRQVGGLGTPDILVVVLIAEIAGNAITVGSESVIEGAVLVATVLMWSFLFEWLQYRFPRLERLLQDRKLKLIDDGRLLHGNMRREFVTHEELMSQLRTHGIDDPAKVKAAYMEANGKITVVKLDAAS